MANPPSDRQRTRNDLREIAKLANHGFGSADSSGYVDLSAFSAQDGDWIDRELGRASGGPSPSNFPSSPGRILTAGSMAPVALESLLPSADETANVEASRITKKRAIYAAAAAAGLLLVGTLTFAVGRHAPAASVPPVAAAAPPPAPDPLPAAPDTTQAAAPASTDVGQPPTASDIATAPTTKKKWGAGHGHHGSPTYAASFTAPKKASVSAGKSKSSGGGDLLDLIKKSVASGK